MAESTTMEASQSPPQQRVGSKLRNSCEECAAAKVGCTKEKPACARCIKRGSVCIYLPTKRVRRTSPGRPNGSRHATTQSDHRAKSMQVLDNITLARASPTRSESIFPSPESMQQSVWPASPAVPDFFSEFISAPEHETVNTINDIIPPDLDDISGGLDVFGSVSNPDPASVVTIDTMGIDTFFDGDDHSVSGTNSHTGAASSISSLTTSTLLTDDTAPTLNSIDDFFPSLLTGDPTIEGLDTLMSSPFDIGTSTKTEDSSLSAGKTRCIEGSSSCLLQALGLLAQSSPSSMDGCIMNASHPSMPAQARAKPFKTLLSENEQTVAAVEKLLQCPCTRQGFTPILLSLIVFSVLSRYDVAARSTKQQSQPSRDSDRRLSSSSVHDLTSESQSRAKIQQILSKLSSVQSLVNQLTQQLKELADASSPAADDFSYRSNVQAMAVDTVLQSLNSSQSPPTDLYRVVSADLRKRLYTLSQNLIDSLRVFRS